MRRLVPILAFALLRRTLTLQTPRQKCRGNPTHYHFKHPQPSGYVRPDKFLNDLLFRNKTHGTYVEAGVLNPTTASTGYFFDRELCWRGVCIDGQEKVHKRLLKSDRTCNKVHGILCGHDGKDVFWDVSGKGSALSGIESTLSGDHRRDILAHERAGTWSVSRKNVTCYQLQTLLKKSGIGHVDVLLMDIEGGEQAVLPSIDFSKLDIDHMFIELSSKSEVVPNWLSKYGYKRVTKYGDDTLFSRQSGSWWSRFG